MATRSSRVQSCSRGLLNNYRYLCKRAMMTRSLESARATRKYQQKIAIANRKRKTSDKFIEPVDSNKLVKKTKTSQHGRHLQPLSADVSQSGLSNSKPSDHHTSASEDSWEVDSGFCSETSPPTSGRSSPIPGKCFTTVVALDCEMVGTGPRGCHSELARCSILDYHGNILYDKYVQPRQPVTNYRTRWSGIQRHHLLNATPFSQAREEILGILEGKVVIGHSVYHDFEVLEVLHPAHMVRDTITTRLLSRLAGFPGERCASLKTLSRTLLNRKIQVGKQGHSSVEDAQAALDLYKLVEEEWEWDLQEKMRDDTDTPQVSRFAALNHYMQDEYWPDDVTAESQ